MGSCISRQGSEQHDSNRPYSPAKKPSKVNVEPDAQEPSLEEAINRIEESKESTQEELKKLQQQLNETGLDNN